MNGLRPETPPAAWLLAFTMGAAISCNANGGGGDGNDAGAPMTGDGGSMQTTDASGPGKDGASGSGSSGGGSSGSSSGGGSPGLPPGVTLQAIDGESMLDATTMTHDYYARNGFTYATSSKYSGPSWDDRSFFPLQCFYGLYSDSTSQFLDLGLRVSNAVTGDTDMNATFPPNGIWAVVGGGGSLENAVGDYAAGLHVDEADPSVGIAAIPDATQSGRFWDITETWNNIIGGDIGGTPMSKILSAGTYKTPNGNPRSVDVFSIDIYWFAGSTTSFTQYEGGCLFSNPMAWGAANATADQVARGSNYGNMIDVFRSWGNGTNSQNGSGAAGTSGAPSRIPFTAFVENKDGLIGPGSRLITPPELNWAAWSSLIHGARAIDYFTAAYGHNGGFDPTVQGGQTISVYDQAKATNTLINDLAPILNSPFALGYAKATPHGYSFPVYEKDWLNGGIETMVKWYQGGKYSNGSGTFTNGFYIFATTRSSESATNMSAVFTLSDPSVTSVNVVGENRSIKVAGGQFADTFANAWSVHVYQAD